MKRILYINKDGIIGGSAISLLLLLKNLKNHYLYVILGKDGPLKEEILKLNIPCKVINFYGWRNLKNIFRNLYAILRLKFFLRRMKFDIIHSNSYEVNPLMVLAATGKENTICHIRDVISYEKAKKYLLYKANILVAVSKAVKKSIKDINKIEVVYNGVDLKETQYSTITLKNFINKPKRNNIYVGIIGSCEEGKRQEDFVKAALLVLKKRKNYRFFIVGDTKNEYCEKVKKMIKGYNSYFYFIPFQKNIFGIIKSLDIVVVASKSESFSRVAVESMAVKRPVIATNVGGIPEVVVHNQTGILYKPFDYYELADYILKIGGNKRLRNEMGNKGYIRVKRNFSAQRYIKNILKIYKETIMLITTDFPPQKGGISAWAYQEYMRLKKEYNVIVIDKAKHNVNKLKEVTYYNNFNNLKNIVKNKVEQEKIKKIIFFHWEPAKYIFLWLVLKKIPYIVVLHGWEFLQPRSFLTETKKRLILKFASEIWVTTPYMKEKVLQRNIDYEKIKIIPIPIDKKRFKKLPTQIVKKLKEGYGLQNKKIILTVARLVERKGIDIVIRSVKIIKSKIPEIMYVIIGEGYYREKLESLVKNLRLSKYVKFIGEVSDKELVNWYNICDIFVLTPIEIKEKGDIEGFGIVYHEAALCGKPVVGADTGGVKYALQNIKHSHIIKPGDYKNLAKIIIDELQQK